jgi:hypothetical protein
VTYRASSDDSSAPDAPSTGPASRPLRPLADASAALSLASASAGRGGGFSDSGGSGGSGQPAAAQERRSSSGVEEWQSAHSDGGPGFIVAGAGGPSGSGWLASVSEG